jgi:NAD(P)-dependent dehydrogenase (short-subunit alcohol dehydrogenase family)
MMTSLRKVALVTGGNKGIGFATVLLLAQKGYFVYIGCRDRQRGVNALDKLKKAGVDNVAVLELDVSDVDSVYQARLQFEKQETHLDVLINNAAIGGMMPQSASSIDIGVLKDVFQTNFFGAVMVTCDFLNLLRKSDQPRIVNVSSELGSLAYLGNSSSGHFASNLMAYCSSKAALNSFTVLLAKELGNSNFKINSVTPGFTATDLTNHSGIQLPEEAAITIVKYALLNSDGPTGDFFRANAEMPW